MHFRVLDLAGVLLVRRVNLSWPSEKGVRFLELGLRPWCLLSDLKALADALSVLPSLW